MLGWLALLLALLVALFYLLTGEGSPVAGMDTGERWFFIIAGSAMAFYALLLTADSGNRMLQNLRHLAIWAGLGFLLIAGYSYRSELGDLGGRISSELTPPGQTISVAGREGEIAVRIRKRPGGHFVARGDVNGAGVTMLVDTGASTVVLRPRDAARAGIDLSSLRYSAPVSTANGTTFAAPVRLRSVAIGGIVLEDVEALVSKPGTLNESLLGMSFLRRLRSYEFTGEFLTLRG